jgi:hypothetical protein
MHMDDIDVRVAARNARKGIAQYLWLMRTLHKVDARSDKDFQRRYNSYYRVRQRSPEWYSTYYNLLEANKATGADFAEVLDTLWEQLGRYEPSFTTKLVATINPNTPVWDRFVIQNTGLQAPAYTDPLKKENAKVVYRQISDWYTMCLASADGRQIIKIFSEEVPEYEEIADLKKIDFVLWQSRG